MKIFKINEIPNLINSPLLPKTPLKTPKNSTQGKYKGKPQKWPKNTKNSQK